MKKMLKDALILFLITLVAGLALGYVNYITREPIKKAETEAQEKAYKEVFNNADSFLTIEGIKTDEYDMSRFGYSGIRINKALMAKAFSGELLGYVLDITTKNGFGGDIVFSMGIEKDGMIRRLSILSISETAGLGMRADEVIRPQFSGKPAGEYEVITGGGAGEGQIDAISGATITSKAITEAVNAGVYFYQNMLEGGNYEE